MKGKLCATSKLSQVKRGEGWNLGKKAGCRTMAAGQGGFSQYAGVIGSAVAIVR